MTAEDVGYQSVSGAKSPIKLSDVLPPGLKAVAIEATKPAEEYSFNKSRPQLGCSLATLTCTLSAAQAPLEALAPYDQLEMRIAVDVEPGAVSGEENVVRISGGDSFLCEDVAPAAGAHGDSGCMGDVGGLRLRTEQTGVASPAQISRPIITSSAVVPFGVEDYGLASEEEGGAPSTQAGAHPFQLTTAITLNQTADTSPREAAPGKPQCRPGRARQGCPLPLARGTDRQPHADRRVHRRAVLRGHRRRGGEPLPAQSAVGVATATVNEPADLGRRGNRRAAVQPRPARGRAGALLASMWSRATRR